MFTGFASQNTPAIQVWDFFRTFASTSADRSVSLTDDCAPIQFFRTGASSTPIQVYLPSAPIEGKPIQIINQSYGSNSQRLQIRTSENGGNGTTGVPFTVGPGASITILYSKNWGYGTTSGNNETGWLSLNFGSPSAANFNAVVVGNPSNTASVNSSAVLGGINNNASGAYAAVAGGANNTANNTGAAVVGGQTSTASNQNAVVVGGQSNTASGQHSVVVGGSSNSATNQFAFAAGRNNTSDGELSVVIGGYYGRARGIKANFVVPASEYPAGFTSGGSQSATLILGRQTTDATATRLTNDPNSAQTTNQVILPNNSAYYFRGSITAGVTGGGNSAMWSFEGGIKRGAGATFTTLIQSVINQVAADAGAATWAVALTADTTNGGLAVTVTGQAATTIRWVCKIETTEMTY